MPWTWRPPRGGARSGVWRSSSVAVGAGRGCPSFTHRPPRAGRSGRRASRPASGPRRLSCARRGRRAGPPLQGRNRGRRAPDSSWAPTPVVSGRPDPAGNCPPFTNGIGANGGEDPVAVGRGGGAVGPASALCRIPAIKRSPGSSPAVRPSSRRKPGPFIPRPGSPAPGSPAGKHAAATAADTSPSPALVVELVLASRPSSHALKGDLPPTRRHGRDAAPVGQSGEQAAESAARERLPRPRSVGSPPGSQPGLASVRVRLADEPDSGSTRRAARR